MTFSRPGPRFNDSGMALRAGRPSPCPQALGGGRHAARAEAGATESTGKKPPGRCASLGGVGEPRVRCSIYWTATVRPAALGRGEAAVYERFRQVPLFA